MSADTQLEAYRFSDATERGEVVHESGYHQPQNSFHTYRCGCDLTTAKGAYRDVTVEMPDGITAHYYHQSAVVVTDGDRYRLDSHGYKERRGDSNPSSTTRERINRYLPSRYNVIQRDFEWYVKTPDGECIEFEDGMVIEP